MTVEFRCRRCGACCRQPGFVRLAQNESAAIAGFLGISEPEFTEKFADLAPDRRGLILKERPDGACTLLSDTGQCRANPVKPRQCRDFPFHWTNTDSAAICPGLSEP